MKTYAKHDFPVESIRQLLEPGPVVLVSSHFKGERDIMTMGWHTVMEFSPSLVGCIIASANHSFALISKTKECIINIPDSSMLDTVIAIGNSSGKEGDKFARFGLTEQKAASVQAPLIGECFASLECKIHDRTMIQKYNFFIFEVVKAHVAKSSKHTQTLHYMGQGRFMKSGDVVSRARQFTRLKNEPNF